MTAQCPICRSPVAVDDTKITGEGLKTTCPLCDEVFLVKPASAQAPPSPSGTRSLSPSGGSSPAGHTGSGSASSSPASNNASRRILEEDSGDGAAPRVLVAHDSHVFGQTVKTLLEEEGFDVDVVHDGEEAMAALTGNMPAVAILEAALPKRFGFQICADIRGRPEPQPIKLMLVASVYDRKRMARSPAMSVPPDDYLEPRNIELELVPKVRKLLRGREITGSRSIASGTRGDFSRPERSEAPPRAPEVLPPRQASRKDPTHPTHPTMGEEDYADLFEESSSASVSRSLEAGPREPPPIDDVESFLAAKETPRSEAESDPLAAAPALARPNARMPMRIGDDPIVDSGDREIWEKVLAEDDKEAPDDDELLRTLMEMAQGSNETPAAEDSRNSRDDLEALAQSEPGEEPDESEDEPVNRSQFEDQDLGGGAFELDEAPAAEEPLDDILDQVSAPEAKATPHPPDELLRGDDFLSEDLPGEDYAAASADSDDAALESVLSEGRQDSDDQEGLVDEEDPSNQEAVTADDLEAGTELSSRYQKPESSRPTDRLLEERNRESASTELPGGAVVPDMPTEIPTVLRNKVMAEENARSSPPPVVMSGDDAPPAQSWSTDTYDDEKSLAEAPAAVPTSDDLDQFLDNSLSGLSTVDNAVGSSTNGSGEPGSVTNGGVAPSEPKIDEEHAKAKRLAKLIVGDILLYNADKIPDAVKSGTFFDVMKGDIKDGREFYDEKVSEEVRSERDYIQELLEETLERKKKELGLL